MIKIFEGDEIKIEIGIDGVYVYRLSQIVGGVSLSEMRMACNAFIEYTKNQPKTCPVCGGNRVDMKTIDGEDGETYKAIYCRDCEIRGPSRLGEPGAIRAWNQLKRNR